jgi:hypothetical protein
MAGTVSSLRTFRLSRFRSDMKVPALLEGCKSCTVMWCRQHIASPRSRSSRCSAIRDTNDGFAMAMISKIGSLNPSVANVEYEAMRRSGTTPTIALLNTAIQCAYFFPEQNKKLTPTASDFQSIGQGPKFAEYERFWLEIVKPASDVENILSREKTNNQMAFEKNHAQNDPLSYQFRVSSLVRRAVLYKNAASACGIRAFDIALCNEYRARQVRVEAELANYIK